MVKILKDLFSRDIFARDRKPERPLRDMPALMKPLAIPAVQLVKGSASSLSHFGGAPELPADVPWPQKKGKKLDFLLRLSLSELSGVLAIDWLPKSGALLFFYDIEGSAWGFDPKDRGSCVVLHVPDHEDAPREGALPHRGVNMRLVEVFPYASCDAVNALDLTDEEGDAYCDRADAAYGTDPKHQVGGVCQPVQDDGMELECQLASNGLYVGDGRGYKDPRARELEPGAKDWRLLLQFDTDDDLDVMWGDGGILYFWIQEPAARAGKFDNVWLVQQCH